MTRDIPAAESPFDNKNRADIVLRTCDNVDFYVYKNILSLASPFFEDMFSLKQPTQTIPSDLPVNVPETSGVLNCILRICYPIIDLPLTDIQLISDCLGVAFKYDLTQAVAVLSRALREFLKTEPLVTYAIACRWNLEAIAKEAAGIWYEKRGGQRGHYWTELEFVLTDPGASYVQAMDGIPAASFHALLSYLKTGYHVNFCTPPPIDTLTSAPLASAGDFPWRSCEGTDIIIRSSDGVDYMDHAVMLSMSSKVLDGLLKNIVRDKDGKLPVLELSGERGRTLIRAALMLSWRDLSIPQLSLDLTYAIFTCASKYQLPSTREFLDRRLKLHLPQDALRVYLMAARNNLVQAARDAAVHLARYGGTEQYNSDLEITEARHYYTLLRFVHRYRQILTGLCGSGHDITAALRRKAREYWSLTNNLYSPEEVLAMEIGMWNGSRTFFERYSPAADWVRVKAAIAELKLDFAS